MAIIKNINAEKIQGRLDVTDVSASYLKVTNGIVASTITANLDYSNVVNRPTLVSSSRQIASQISGSFTRVSGSIATRLKAIEGKNLSFATTGSNQFKGSQHITGSLTFARTTDPDIYGTTTTATHLYVSASNNLTGEDLYFRQQDNRVKWKWLEGKLNSGILWGGDLSYNGSNIYVKRGSGIIVNHRASLTHEISPVTTYVLWNDITGSITDIATTSATYVGITSSGSLYQQKEFFTPNQYRNSIPLGLFNHTGKNVITSVANNVVTAYDDVNQTSNFIQAFGPLKLEGLSIIPTGSLSINVEAGSSFILGGFHQQDPNDASHKTTTLVQRAQIARVRRDGNGGFTVDNNNGSFYTTLDTDYWDDGTGTLNTISTGDWQIQRVFFNPFTSRVHIYYGSTLYTSLINAKQYLATDPFTEAPYSSHQYVFIGYLIVKGQTTDLQDTSKNAIIQSGLFRNTVGSSGGVQALLGLHDLNDVDAASPSNGDLLSYSSTTEVWSHTKNLQGTYNITGSLVVTGKITGSTNFNTLLNKPTLVSSSRQIGSEISGSFTRVSASLASRIAGISTSFNDITNKPTLISSSRQIATQISGSFKLTSASFAATIGNLDNIYATDTQLTIVSSSIAGRITNLSTTNVVEGTNLYYRDDRVKVKLNSEGVISGSSQVNVKNTQYYSTLATTGSNVFKGGQTIDGNLVVNGKLTATSFNNVFVSSSTIYTSGSTKFGDTADDKHQFTGSLELQGGLKVQYGINANWFHGDVDFVHLINAPRFVSSSRQIGSEISGSFTRVSSSLASRITNLTTDNVAEGSHLYYTDTRVQSKINANGVISGSSQVFFGGISNKPAGLVSSSRQIGSEISGSFKLVSASLANRIASISTNFYDITNKPTLLSSSRQIATQVSGSFTVVSASLAGRISNISTTWDALQNKPVGIVSSSLQLYNTTLKGMVISGSFSGSYKGDGSGLTGVQTTVVQNATAYDTFTGATSKTISHNFGTKNVIVSVYDNNDALIIPSSIVTTDTNTVTLGFAYATTGRAVVAKGGHIVSGSLQDYTYRESITGNTSYTITHNLNEDYPIVQVYSTSKEQVIPSKIKSTSANAVLIEFNSSFSGTVVVKK